MNPPVIHWFRQDLRITDNPSLFEAARIGEVLPIYILDDVHSEHHAIGGASRWWLHHSLQSLNSELSGKLRVFSGDPLQLIPRLIEQFSAQRIHWNRCYEPWQIKRDAALKNQLHKSRVEARSFNGSLLWEPGEILKKDGTPYRVFTPYYQRGCQKGSPPRPPLPKPENLRLFESDGACAIEELRLLPEIRWDKMLEPYWAIGETGAHATLQHFLEQGLDGYTKKRDFPACKNVSRLSPYLHWGEISPHQVWHSAHGAREDAAAFRRQMAWREFSNYLLYHFPEITDDPFNQRFNRFQWISDNEKLSAWQKGQTGIPIIDAGMRELWQTGTMHNRIRMIVASFLTKNLLLHWHHGRDWFNDCLVDADLANNCGGWQWIAGCGADAAPYFRIFNPVTQGKKFDPDGEYTRRYVLELAALPNKFLFNPWEAPAHVLRAAGVALGNSYPYPIVDLKESRKRALNAYHGTADA